MPTSMSDDHKAALADGRRHSHAVRRYLEAIAETDQQSRRHPDELTRELARVDEAIDNVDPLARLQLLQLRANLREEIEKARSTPNATDLEPDFLVSAPAYSESKGISHEAWVEVGVDPEVLARAGIVRRKRRIEFAGLDFDDEYDDDLPSLVGLDPVDAVRALLGPEEPEAE